MQVRYFPDTDTLLIDFADRDIAETTDINENVLDKASTLALAAAIVIKEPEPKLPPAIALKLLGVHRLVGPVSNTFRIPRRPHVHGFLRPLTCDSPFVVTLPPTPPKTPASPR